MKKVSDAFPSTNLQEFNVIHTNQIYAYEHFNIPIFSLQSVFVPLGRQYKSAVINTKTNVQ